MREINRREALKSGLAVLSAVGIDGEVGTISARDPQAFVITHPKNIPERARVQLREQWHRTFYGTGLEKIPVVILPEGMRVEVVDKMPLPLG